MRKITRIKKMLAFLWPWLKNKVGITTPYWFYLNVTTACNKKCGYCVAVENNETAAPPISFITAKKAIDAMHSRGCRMMGLMGGEPLLLKKTLVAIIEYATGKGIITYLPTNLSLLNEELLNDLIEAGVTMIDVAVDTVTQKPGLSKSLEGIRGNLSLVLNSRKRGVIVKMNTTITRQNLDDVRELVEFAHRNKVSITLHIVERFDSGAKWIMDSLFFREEDFPEIERLAHWLMQKQADGYRITNPPWYFKKMVEMVKHSSHSGWNCMAGRKTFLIDEQGKFYPCLSLKGQGEWGDIYSGGKFDDMDKQLLKCNKNCLSCINTISSHFERNPITLLRALWG